MRHVSAIILCSALLLLSFFPPISARALAGLFKGSSPSDVVRACLEAANQGRYSEARQYIHHDTIEDLSGDLGLVVGQLDEMLDELTQKGTIVKTRILKQDIQGEKAEVAARIEYRDGYIMEKDLYQLVRHDGKWLITLESFIRDIVLDLAF